MSTETVSTKDPKGNPSAHVHEWLPKMTEKHFYGENAARLRRSSLRAMESVLTSDEPKTIRYLLENIESIKSRYMVGTSANPATAATYASRAVGTLNDYVLYLSDPDEFVRKKTRTKAPGTSSSKPDKKSKKAAAETTPPVEPTPPTPPSPNMREYDVGDGRVVQFTLPSGLTWEEFKKLVLHMYTLTGEFDPAMFGPLAQSMSDMPTLRAVS